MIKADELKKLTEEHLEKDGLLFKGEILPAIEKELIVKAGKGEHTLQINVDSGLNVGGWLSKPHLYKPVIKELEDFGYKMAHNNDSRDGIYLIINW